MAKQTDYSQWDVADRTVIRAAARGGAVYVDGVKGTLTAEEALELGQTLVAAAQMAKNGTTVGSSPNTANVADLSRIVREHSAAADAGPVTATADEMANVAKLGQLVGNTADQA